MVLGILMLVSVVRSCGTRNTDVLVSVVRSCGTRNTDVCVCSEVLWY